MDLNHILNDKKNKLYWENMPYLRSVDKGTFLLLRAGVTTYEG